MRTTVLRVALSLGLAALLGAQGSHAQNAPAPAAAKAPTNMRIVPKPLELTIHMHWADQYVYDSDWVVEKKAAEITGISLKGVASKATTRSEEAFNLMMAAGNLPDIVAGERIKEPANQYGMEGAFIPLDDLIDKYAPNLKKFFAANPLIRQAIAAPNGKIYYIPYIPDGKFSRGWFIRQDWLDKLGLKAPQNVDELYAVLTAFKTKDPNGNGQADEVPLLFREPQEVSRLLVLWGARTSGTGDWHDFYVDKGVIKHPYGEEVYRKAVANVAKWYKEGLIDKEVFTRGARAREQLLGSNVGGATHDWFGSTAVFNTTFGTTIPGFKFLPFPPPADSNGKRIEEARRATYHPHGWVITARNKHPIETIKYFDFWFSDYGRRLANFGIEGVHFTLVNGKAVFKPEVLNSKTSVLNQMRALGAQIPRGFYQDFEYERQWTNEIGLQGIDMYEKGNWLLDEFLGVSYTAPEKAIYDQYWPSLRTYMLEKQQAWILGSADVNAEWDAYKAQLVSLGLPKVLEVMNTAYKRTYATRAVTKPAPKAAVPKAAPKPVAPKAAPNKT